MDQEGHRRERSRRLALAEKRIGRFYWMAALILAVGVRLYLFENYYTINNDGIVYIDAARHFWRGEWGEGLGSFYPPLFPLMIAAVYPLVGDWELAGQFWPLLLSLLIPLPLFGLLSRIHGPRVAQVALVFYGVSPYLARLSLEVRSELPYSFFVVLALFLLQRALDDGRLLPLFLMGISCALAYLARPEGIGLMVVGVSYLVYRGWDTGRAHRPWLKAGAVALGFLLFAAPYILYLRWDTGKWLISRKASFIVALGLARYDPDADRVGVKESDQVGIVRQISSRPLSYAKKVFIDAFRSLGFYFEALHYSYLPFLFIGWIFYFRGRFWEKPEFLLFAVIASYLAAFSLLYVTRRYGVPLASISLGWVAAGFLAVKEYSSNRWGRRGILCTGIILAAFVGGTLPKTLQAIGKDKFYLREAGVYLKERPGRPTIVTTNGRVGFYAAGQNRILIKKSAELPDLLSPASGDYLALDKPAYLEAEASLAQHGWSLDREFTGGEKEGLFILCRAKSP